MFNWFFNFFGRRKYEAKLDEAEKEIETLKAFRKIGGTFQYLNTWFIVVDYYYCEIGCCYPALVTEYKDNYGKIQRKIFYPYQIEMLKKINMEK